MATLKFKRIELLKNLGLLFASIVVLFTLLSLSARLLRISPITSSNCFIFNLEANNYETNRAAYPNFLFQSFPKYKDSNTYRIFIFGGSSIFNLRDCAYLKELLTKEFSSRNFEIINAGAVAYGTTKLIPVMEDALNYDPDLFIIYCGHNEFLEKFLLETPFLKVMVPLNKNLSRFREYVLLARIFNKIRLNPLDKSGCIKWGHPYTATERQKVYKHYESNIRKMVNFTKEKKVGMVISTVAYNYVDDRYVSLLYYSPRHNNTKLSRSQIDIDNIPDSRLFELADGSRGDPYIENRLGAYYLKNGNYDLARKHFINAADNDLQPFRANAITNGIVRNIASDLDVPLADVESAVTQRAPNMIPDFSLFVDYCHLDADGNRLMQTVFFNTIKNLLTSKGKPKAKGDVP